MVAGGKDGYVGRDGRMPEGEERPRGAVRPGSRMSFIVFLIVIALGGLLVGALARLALPGKDPMSARPDDADRRSRARWSRG